MSNIVLSDNTRKRIAEYFDGDAETSSVYNYRTYSNIVSMYDTRFGQCDYERGSSRWMIGDGLLIYMQEQGKLNDFFNTMLSTRNIGKELGTANKAEWAAKRSEAIKSMNDILMYDDLELLDIAGNIIVHVIDDETDLVGSGGFANVYRVPGSNMVVKKLKDEFKNNAGIVSRFKNEFYLISEKLLGINGIITGYDYYPDDISYTMEYCSSDLRDYIAKANLDKPRQVDLILEILEIMKQVHDRNVLHRDLSPKNIFIKDGHPIIADFGLGKAIDENGRTYITIDTSCNGTLEYCDPRQFQGLGFADEQSDIYSLGRIINYIMTEDSDNFKHQLTIVSTIATQSSLDARFHTIQEMIDRVSKLTKIHNDPDYETRCEKLVAGGYYDKTMDEYLLYFAEDELLQKLNDKKFSKIYKNVITNPTYDAVAIEKFSTLRNIFHEPVGHTWALFDEVSNFCVDILKNNRGLTPALKTILGECIHEVAVGMTRWDAQAYFKNNYRSLEAEYVQDTIDEISNWRLR